MVEKIGNSSMVLKVNNLQSCWVSGGAYSTPPLATCSYKHWPHGLQLRNKVDHLSFEVTA